MSEVANGDANWDADLDESELASFESDLVEEQDKAAVACVQNSKGKVMEKRGCNISGGEL